MKWVTVIEVNYMVKKSLYPTPEPIKVNPLGVIFMAFAFALLFFIIGFATMHYPKIASVI